MKPKWKRVFVLSSLGSLAVGTTLSLVRKSRKPTLPPLAYKKIPAECQRISLWTERFRTEKHGVERPAYDKYLLQATRFKLWTILDLASDELNGEGVPIYHVTVTRYIEFGEVKEGREEAEPAQKFYGTLKVINSSGKSPGPNYLARGGILEIRKCNVGGATNGVETGEIHRSEGRVLNYRLEYTPKHPVVA
jgi:hypothetical protein